MSADGDVTLTWRAPRTGDVEGYEVYRKTTNSQARTAPAAYHPGAVMVVPAAYHPMTVLGARRPISGNEPITERRYTDTSTRPGNRYVYTVKAVGPDGTRSTAARKTVWVPKPQPVAEGQLRSELGHNLCIGERGNDSGSSFVTVKCGSATDWDIYDVPGDIDAYTLRSDGECLDVSKDPASGKMVPTLASCDPQSSTQRWSYRWDDDARRERCIKNIGLSDKDTEMVLDVNKSDTTPQTPIIVYPKNTPPTSNQQWSLLQN